MGLRFRESRGHRGPGSAETPLSHCQGQHVPGSCLAPGGREGRGAWRRALGGSVLQGREGGCGCRLWAPGWNRAAEAQLHSPPHRHLGQPSSSRALGPGGCSYQTLSNAMCLMRLDQAAELPPAQELCTGQQGVPRGLQRSRGWEMAPQRRGGHLAPSLLLTLPHNSGHCTLATLLVWSCIRRNSGSRTSFTVLLIIFLFLPTTVSNTSLKRLMESSRTRLDSW